MTFLIKNKLLNNHTHTKSFLKMTCFHLGETLFTFVPLVFLQNGGAPCIQWGEKGTRGRGIGKYNF